MYSACKERQDEGRNHEVKENGDYSNRHTRRPHCLLNHTAHTPSLTAPTPPPRYPLQQVYPRRARADSGRGGQHIYEGTAYLTPHLNEER